MPQKCFFGGGAKMPFVLLILQKHRLGLYSRVWNLEVMKLSILAILGGHDDDCGIITSG
jgi:hypothetical protein